MGNHSCYASIEEERFLQGTTVCQFFRKTYVLFRGTSFEKTGVASWKTSWTRTSIQLPLTLWLNRDSEEIRGGEYRAIQLFGLVLDGLLELGWVGSSEVETPEADFNSSFREQQQVGRVTEKHEPLSVTFFRFTAASRFPFSPQYIPSDYLSEIGHCWLKFFNLYVSAVSVISVDCVSGHRSF